MERRKHPRIQLPLLVELQHPSFGRRDCVARDISEGGVYVHVETSGIRKGAELKLTLKNPNTIDSQPTPTVAMEVRRVEPDGLGLAFVNKTSRHLWESVERLRGELAVGRDYFQLHVSALALREDGRLLVVQQGGRWTFPGTYLIVGDDWRAALKRALEDRFNLAAVETDMSLLGLETEAIDRIPEAAVAKVFAVMSADTSSFEFEPGERYKDFRWVRKTRILDELTFVDDLSRRKAMEALSWFESREDRA
jgi:ADP-ribose pyrophosphatase YjhB (NUDIX family)